MKGKLKSVLSMVLALVMIASFTACNQSQTAEPSASSSQPAASSEVSSAAPSESTSETVGRYHKLTQEDVMSFYTTESMEEYKDMYMTEAIKPASQSALELTEEEKQKIRDMNLKVAFEKDALDDPGKWQLAGAQEVADDLGITIADIWVAADKTGNNQLDDYTRIEAIADQYDAIFTLPIDLASTSEILKKIMKKTKMGFICAAPFEQDWSDPNFIGVSDADNYIAGVYSAEAAVKILGGKGTIGMVGWENGHNGSFQTCQQRYLAWEDVLEKYPDIKVVDKWYDSPGNAKQVVSGLLSANPDIELLLIDFANPPADQAQALFKEMGYKAWEDMVMVTIDTDATIAVPMATDGPDNNYTAAFAGQDWYGAGRNVMIMYAKHLLYGDDAPKFVTAPPTPISTYESLKTNFVASAPKGWEIPEAVMNLDDATQWTFDIKE